MDRLGDDVRRTLRAAGAPALGPLTEITRAWPAAVGPAIARAAWPLRLSRDGTLHVATSSSAWAFELTALAGEILERLQAAAPADPPAALRFAPGPLPAAPADPLLDRAPSRPQAGAEEHRLADAAAAAIEDEELRAIAARAAAASLARRLEAEPADRHF